MAMFNYESRHGRLPPAVVYGLDGQPLYSWRVLMLPYIEQNALYEQFHLDEPWDSPHNITLLPKMPSVFAPPYYKRSKVPPYHTVCHVFVGKGAAFEGREGLRVPEDFPKGSSNTFLVVEAGAPVPWSKPEDLTYEPDGPLPDLRGLFKDGFRACLADGSARFVRKEVSEPTLRWAISRDSQLAGSIDW
jgi:Protein of unknown function (DUF1559)